MSTKIQIPEKIQNEVKMLDNQFDDYAADLQKIKRKMDISKSRMWDLLGDYIPEVNKSAAKFNRKEMCIEVDLADDENPANAIKNLFKGLLGGEGGLG